MEEEKNVETNESKSTSNVHETTSSSPSMSSMTKTEKKVEEKNMLTNETNSVVVLKNVETKEGTVSSSTLSSPPSLPSTTTTSKEKGGKGNESGGGGNMMSVPVTVTKQLSKEEEEKRRLIEEKKSKGPPIGTIVESHWRNKDWKAATIIEREWVEDFHGSKPHWRYYVHYAAFNRRMDEWITDERMKVIKLPDVVEKSGTKGSKRKNKDENHIRATAGVLSLIAPDHDEHYGMDEASIAEHEHFTKVKNINTVCLGRAEMDTWYFSPYPKELFRKGRSLDSLHICEFCLKFFARREELERHESKCYLRHPPGNEIYRHNGISMFEVDGGKESEYCENLCYLAKLFLDHKTLFYDVEPFLFYIMCTVDEYGFHIVGYYSKEKYSESGYNLACILTLPAFQRRGYGRFLIQFSYELSKIEKRVGSPEKPLSDLGLVSYRAFWGYELCKLLKAEVNSLAEDESLQISIIGIAQRTSFKTEDIKDTLQHLNLLQYGYGHGDYYFHLDMSIIDKILSKPPRGPQVDPNRLHWAPLQLERHKMRDKYSLQSQLRVMDDD